MIEVKGLTKRYGEHTAVSDLSFTIEDDQVYGFLGPNGAGKSTTMNIITGCLAATSGNVRIDGRDIYEEAVEVKKKIGYLPEIPPLYTDMTPREYLFFVARAKKIQKEEIKNQVETAMEETGIKAVEDRLIKSLSKGYKQRVGIAQALLGNPAIVILDEPTVGLDPKQIIEIRELIKELGKKHTVILSSHILSEVQAVCDKIMIISDGKLVACDTPENLENLFAGSKTVKLTAKATFEEIEVCLANIPEIKEISCISSREDRTVVQLTADCNADIAEDIFFAFCDIRKPIVAMTEENASLEDIFLELTSDDNKENLNFAEEKAQTVEDSNDNAENNDALEDDNDDGSI